MQNAMYYVHFRRVHGMGNWVEKGVKTIILQCCHTTATRMIVENVNSDGDSFDE